MFHTRLQSIGSALIACLPQVASAADLQVEVRKDLTQIQRTGLPPAPEGVVQLVRGEAELDGKIVEDVWVRAQPQKLGPLSTGRRPPSNSLRVAYQDNGLFMSLIEPPEDQTARILVDPNGLGQTWWIVALYQGQAAWYACRVPEEGAPKKSELRQSNEHCEPTKEGLRSRHSKDGWELFWPWRVMARPTTAMRIGWLQQGHRGTGGTWAAKGSAKLSPTDARKTSLPQPPAMVRAQTDCDKKRWTATVHPRGKAATGRWVWSRWHHGERIDRGPLELTGEPLTFEMPWSDRKQVAVELRQMVDGLPLRTVVDQVRWETCEMGVSTPSFTDRIEVSYDLPDPAEGVRVKITTPKGTVLGTAQVDIPKGRGELHIAADPAWPADVQVSVGHWLDGVAATRRDTPVWSLPPTVEVQ